MARTHEVPNHLNVQDTLFLGLTARQVATFMAFASPAYGVWEQAGDLPLLLRGGLALALALLGLVFALVRGKGRTLDEWLFAMLAYSLQARRMTWQRTLDETPDPTASAGWAELDPELGWIPAAVHPGLER